jgi:hypothetical protein
VDLERPGSSGLGRYTASLLRFDSEELVLTGSFIVDEAESSRHLAQLISFSCYNQTLPPLRTPSSNHIPNTTLPAENHKNS